MFRRQPVKKSRIIQDVSSALDSVDFFAVDGRGLLSSNSGMSQGAFQGTRAVKAGATLVLVVEFTQWWLPRARILCQISPVLR